MAIHGGRTGYNCRIVIVEKSGFAKTRESRQPGFSDSEIRKPAFAARPDFGFENSDFFRN